ncbi:MarR family winged helix-turn-helix transcriptional regulator [Galbitalea soli]|uniref:MarR family transcriptional regulator n=1 Tax=Galbitalea soli TaxID=1268042 RepID=A0A7C9TP67_9MICO|nr:MarR family transcriptional regulator [Galbitalea soli]NEM89940.1 MarR family transcriptional regulator [Galbitalea soli]NYJ30646.1 DNA-binding MarR family transcriptional regulator [Galbitalea soli]
MATAPDVPVDAAALDAPAAPGADATARPGVSAAVLDGVRQTLGEARRLSARLASVLAPEGFLVDELLILETLQRRPGLTMTELHEEVLADKATLGRRIDGLSTRALVFREVDATDRRVLRVYLSRRGAEELSRLAALLAEPFAD